MLFRNRLIPFLLSLVSGIGLVLLPLGTALHAQSSGFELHAQGKITPADIGLPAYPGAQLFKDGDSDPTVDMGFTFGDTHFRLLAANYASDDSTKKILDFYRKPLARYGEVLECDHGQPVGAIKVTRSGLTCDSDKDGHGELYGKVNSSEDYELRAGTPQRFHIVGVGPIKDGRTRFGLIYVELPRDAARQSD